MKLTVNLPLFRSAFAAVASAVPTRTPKPILQNVKLIASKSGIVLTASDGDISVRHQVGGVVSFDHGELLLPSSRLQQILRELTGETLAIETHGKDRVSIEAGFSEFTVGTEPPEEFPDVPPMTDDVTVTISGAAFGSMLRRTVFCTDPDSTRYALGGVLFEHGPSGLICIATDSRRLAVATCSPGDTFGPGWQRSGHVVVPSRAVRLIESAIDADEQAKLAIRQNDIAVQVGDTTIYSRLVEGRFPRWQDVVPKATTAGVETLAGPLLAALRQAQIMTNYESRGVDCTFRDGKLTIKSSAPDLGQSVIELPIVYAGEPITLRLDARYLAEPLKVLGPETSVTLRLTDPDTAVLLVAENYQYVVMPLERDQT